MLCASHREDQSSCQVPGRWASSEHFIAMASLGDIAIDNARGPRVLGKRHGLGLFMCTTAPPAHVLPYLGPPEISELYLAR